MATKWTSPVWRMPENSNQSKLDNYSLDFDSSDRINFGNSLNFNTSNYSCSFWTKDIGNVGGTQVLMEKGTNNTLSIHMQGGGQLFWYGGSGTVPGITEDLQDGNWHHVVCVADGTTSYMYLNGVLKGTGGNRITSSNSHDFVLGGRINGTYSYVGMFSQMAIFDYALSETQVKYLYNDNDTVNPTVANPQNPMAITGPTPIAYYPLGQSATGDDNTLTTPNESGNGDTVFNFEGPNANEQYIDTSFAPNGYTKFTVSQWLNTPSFNARSGLFATYGNSANDFQAFFNTTSNGYLYIYVGGAYALSVNQFATWGLEDKWFHLTLVYDGTFTDSDAATQNAGRLKMYINGSYEAFNHPGSGTIPSSIPTGNTGMYIGTLSPTSYEYGGKMSNVQMWDNSLSSTEITTLYNSGRPYTGTQPQAANLKGWWKMDVDTSNFTDGNQWEVGNSTSDFSSSLKFTGNSQLNLSEINLGTTNSISFWFKVTNVPASNNDFYFLGADNNASNYVLYSANGTSFSLRISPSSDTGFLTFTSTPTLWDGKWHNLLITRNNSTFNMYVDGVALTGPTGSVGTGNTVIDTIANQNNNGVPGYAIYNDAFTGELSNLVVWNSDQTSEKDNIYNNGSPATSYTNTPVSWWKLDNLTTGIQDSVGSNNATLQGTGTSQLNTPVSALNGVSSGMTTANLVTSDLNRSLLYSSYSMDFDAASSDYIQTTGNTIMNGGTEVSLSVWINTQDKTQTQIIVSTFSGKKYVEMSLISGSLYCWLGDGSTTSNYNVVNSTNLNIDNDTWYNFTLVYDGSESTDGTRLKVYKNGSLLTWSTIRTIPTTLANDLSLDFYIGARGGATTFNGFISNASIFNRALSENDILNIYNGGAPNDISSLSPVGWWSLSGDSYFATNWICPDLSTNSNNGTSANMDATNLVGEAPGSTANGTGTSMNIPGNLEGNAPNSDKNAYSVNMVATNRGTSIPDISS